ncbi:MAG: alpha-L-fucosidase [Candidatus Latescibacterota bacterium]
MTEERGDIVRPTPPASAAAGHPEWLQRRLEWFQDLRFGLILHWGIYCQWDCCESWPLVEEDTWARPPHLECWRERGFDLARFSRDYRALNRTFNPVDFEPGAWAAAAGRAGMRYVAFTSKHHDGFCMWDTRTTDYRVTHPDCPFHADPRADVLRHVFDAFRARGLAISCYLSKSDWHSPHYWSPHAPARTRNPNYDTHEYPERWERFVQYTHRQVAELMRDYGPIDVLWLDGGQVRPPDQDIRMDRLAAMARSHQPGLVIADRTVGGAHENFVTPEQMIAEEPLSVPWESCLTMGESWKYVPGDRLKSVPQLLRMLVEVVSKGGNLLLGVGPTPQGALPGEALERLQGLGDWMARNAEAIYATRPVPPCREGEVYFTRRGAQAYAFVFGPDWPERIALRSVQPADGSRVHLLGWEHPLPWERRDGEAVVTLPPQARQRALPEGSWVVRFALGQG